MIRDELQPVIDEKRAAMEALRDELTVLQATLDGRIKQAMDYETTIVEKARIEETIKAFSPEVVAVFEAEAKMPWPDPTPAPAPEPVIP